MRIVRGVEESLMCRLWCGVWSVDAAEEYRLKSILVYSEQVYSFVQRSKNTGDMETPQHGNDSTRKRIKNYF